MDATRDTPRHRLPPARPRHPHHPTTGGRTATRATETVFHQGRKPSYTKENLGSLETLPDQYRLHDKRVRARRHLGVLRCQSVDMVVNIAAGYRLPDEPWGRICVMCSRSASVSSTS